MQIDRRITNGLAWAGLFVVVAIPLADAVSGQLMGSDAQIAVATVADLPLAVAPVPAPLSLRPHAPVVDTAAILPARPVAAKPAAVAVAKPAMVAVPEPVEVAVAEPTVPATVKPAANGVAVDSFLSSGKKLPSYITGGDDQPQQAVAAPSPIIPVPAVTAPVGVAAVPIRPAAPVAPAAAVDPIEVATLTPTHIAPVPMPLSMRPKPITRPLGTATANEDIVVPPEVLANNNAGPVVVDDLRDWESGPLSEFLARRQGVKSSATVTSQNVFPDGFVDDGRTVRRPPSDVYLGPVEEDQGFFPFVN